MTRAPMLLNSFRIACRQLRSPGVTNGSYATLGSLSQFPQTGPAFPHSSVVEHLLKTPPLFPSPPWTPTTPVSRRPVTPFSLAEYVSPVVQVKTEPSPEWRVEQAADEEKSTISLFPSEIPVEEAVDEEILNPLVEEAALPEFHAFIDEIVVSVKKEIKAENSKKKRCVRKPRRPKEETIKTAPIDENKEGEKEEEEDGFMICCGRRAKPIDISPRKRKLPLKTESASAPKKKKVMDAEEMASRIRSQNRAAAKKYRQRMKLKKREMDEETFLLQQEQSRLLQIVQQLEVEVDDYKGKLLKMTLVAPFPKGDNG